MKLEIDISDISEVAQGATMLNSLLVAYRAHQEAVIGPNKATPTGKPAAVAATKPAVAEAAADQADQPARRRGRPSNADKKAAAVAAAQPVGAALAGVPARDLAAALDADGEQTHAEGDVEVRTAAEIPTTETEQVKAGIANDSPLHDPDLAGAFEKPAKTNGAAVGPATAALIDDDALFGGTADSASEFDGMTVTELDARWRTEGSKRGIHWMRNLIEHHKVRSSKDFTRDMLLDALNDPEKYMPPAVA